MGDTENREKGCSRENILNTNSHRLPKTNDKCRPSDSVLRVHRGEARKAKGLQLGILFPKEKENNMLKETGGGHINYRIVDFFS